MQENLRKRTQELAKSNKKYAFFKEENSRAVLRREHVALVSSISELDKEKISLEDINIIPQSVSLDYMPV